MAKSEEPATHIDHTFECRDMQLRGVICTEQVLPCLSVTACNRRFYTELTSKVASVDTVPTSSSEIRPPGSPIFELISLMASFLCLSLSTCSSDIPRNIMPYSAHVASVACSKPESLEMNDHQVLRALMASEFARELDLSEGVSHCSTTF